MEEHAPLPAEFADLANRLDGADFIVRRHDRNKDRVRAERLFHLGGSDLPELIHREVSHVKTAFFEPLTGVQDSVMLNRGGDDMAAFMLERHSFDGPVVALRAAGCEVDFLGMGGVQALHHLTAGVFNRALGLPTVAVDRRGVAVCLGEEGQHCLYNLRRDGGSRGVVQINAAHGDSPLRVMRIL